MFQLLRGEGPVGRDEEGNFWGDGRVHSLRVVMLSQNSICKNIRLCTYNGCGLSDGHFTVIKL